MKEEVGLFSKYLHLHFIVALLGFTAILGALISLDAIPLVWLRTILAAGGLLIYLKLRKLKIVLPFSEQIVLYLIGIVVALHWITFFHAIKVSNVSVTLGVFASTTLFTSLLEPLIVKRPVYWFEVIIGMVIIVGIYIIFQYEFEYLNGILYALLSALLNGIFVVLNRGISKRWDPSLISFYEMIGGFAFISVYMLITNQVTEVFELVSTMDIVWLLILSFICTSYAFAAIVELMKNLSAYNIVLTINLEPVYGIILAFFIFGEAEKMSPAFYLGTVIILISVFSYPFLKSKFARKSSRETNIS